ncbi:MAG TPA: hypothetical protein VNN08_18565 [Thermoanaerobaculia bacterium]|nr:hypothetical protein [Thermoanaerobaculia bacterium]
MFTCVLLVLSLVLGSAGPVVSDTPNLTDVQIRALAAEALWHTPEYTHFTRDTRFQWVVFTASSPDPYPQFTAAVKRRLTAKYVVYGAQSELPPAATRVDESHRIWFVNGFQYSVSVRAASRGRIEVTYRDFEGPLAAGTQVITYQWIGGRWRVRAKGPLIVA